MKNGMLNKQISGGEEMGFYQKRQGRGEKNIANPVSVKFLLDREGPLI